MRCWNAILLIVVVLGGTLGSQELSKESPVYIFREHRSRAIQALKDSDNLTAIQSFMNALEVQPDSGMVLLQLALLCQNENNIQGAKEYLRQFLTRGHVLTSSQLTKFESLMSPDLMMRNSSNASNKGQWEVVTSIDGAKLVESFVINPIDGSLVLSCVHTSVVEDHATRTPLISFSGGESPFAIALRDGTWWLSTAKSNYSNSRLDASSVSQSAIVSIAQNNTEKMKRFQRDVSNIEPNHSSTGVQISLGDLCLGKDRLYVSEANTCSVLCLPGYDGDLQSFSKLGWFGSPQGIVENDEAGVVLVADYSSGLHRIDISTKSHDRLIPSTDSFLIGLDGIYRYKNDVIAIQNGVKPDRILRLRFDDRWTEIRQVEVLLQDSENLVEPTTGMIVGDTFYFIARSQWADFDANGKPKPGPMPPTIIGSLRLN